MKKIFILALLVSFQVHSEDQVDCTTKTVPIKMAGFSGYGDQLKETKQIAQLIKPSEGQVSTYEKSFEIGKYRFVRNDQDWDIYRKNDSGLFEKKKLAGKFQVDADQKIWATVRSDGSINIHRNISGDEYQKELNIFFTRNDIYITGPENKKVFSYKNCLPAATASKTAQVPEPKKVETRK